MVQNGFQNFIKEASIIVSSFLKLFFIVSNFNGCQTPEIKTQEVQTQEKQTPEIQTPEIQTPKIQTPEI